MSVRETLKNYLETMFMIVLACCTQSGYKELLSLNSTSTIGSFFNIKTSYISKSEEISVNDTVDAFEAMAVDLSAAELIVLTGDGYSIHYEGADVPKPTYSVKDGTLKVESPSVKLSWRNSVKCSLTITVPENTKLNGVVFDIDAGNVTFSDCTINSFAADSNMGNVEFGNCTFDRMDATADMGNAEMFY